MASPLTTPTQALYPFPWNPDHDPEAVDRLVLATWRADQLAAHLTARLDALANAPDDAPEPSELHALSLCAVHIRHLLADVTQLAGAYVR